MIRAVFDTNVFISAILFGGLPSQLLRLARSMSFKLVTSPLLLEELVDKLRNKSKQPEDDIFVTQSLLERVCDVVSTAERLSVVKADPDDDRVLECALAGGATFVVTGDRHLLSIGEFRGIAIVAVRQFMDILNPPV